MGEGPCTAGKIKSCVPTHSKGSINVTQPVISRRSALLSVPVAAGAALAATGVAAADEAVPETLASADAVRFLYLDATRLAVGAEQNIVVSLASETDVASAQLTLCCAETGEDLVLDMVGAAGASALFSPVLDSAGTYSVTALSVSRTDGFAQAVDFTDCDAAHRTFVMGAEKGARSDDALNQVETCVSAASPDGALTQDDSLASAASVPVAESLAAAGAAAGAATGGRTTVNFDAQDLAVVVAIDPGHSLNTEPGASGVNGAREEVLNWKIANYCKEELETYAGVQVVLTHGETEYMTLKDRIISSISHNADVVVSIHLNSSGFGGAYGAEVYVPNDASYNPETHTVGEELGKEILSNLEALGLYGRGVKVRTIQYSDLDPDEAMADYLYADGSCGDYYGIIRNARKAGIPGIIVEHAYIDNASDYYSFLSSESKLKQLGVADAEAIAEVYGLSKVKASDLAAVYDEAYYTSQHASEVAQDAKGAFHHFLTVGMAAGYQASAFFSPAYYKNANKDLRDLLGSTMMGYYYHYARFGRAEGRPGTGEAEGVATMWRLYNPYNGEHLYTAEDAERNICVFNGWTYEGIAWDAPEKGTEVYRLYNPFVPGGDHHYTTRRDEYDALAAEGWEQEDVAWHSAPEKGGVALHRLYNPFAVSGTHHYTTSEQEKDELVELGWKYEGIGWYGLATN